MIRAKTNTLFLAEIKIITLFLFRGPQNNLTGFGGPLLLHRHADFVDDSTFEYIIFLRGFCMDMALSQIQRVP